MTHRFFGRSIADLVMPLQRGKTALKRGALMDDVAGREKPFLAINIVGKVRDHLASIVANGKLAQAKLKELAQTAERPRRLGIL